MAETASRRIAFLGTGLMGAPMTRRLLAAGFPVTVWNRDPAKAEPLAAEGATVAIRPAEPAAAKSWRRSRPTEIVFS